MEIRWKEKTDSPSGTQNEGGRMGEMKIRNKKKKERDKKKKGRKKEKKSGGLG